MSNKMIEIENCSECPYKIWNENHKTSECGKKNTIWKIQAWCPLPEAAAWQIDKILLRLAEFWRDSRRAKLRNYRVEIKFVGEPIYQFRVIDLTAKGAGLLIKDDSAFLNTIEVGQIVEVDFIFPEGTAPSGLYKAEIKHITKLDMRKHRGHLLVGLSILKKVAN